MPSRWLTCFACWAIRAGSGSWFPACARRSRFPTSPSGLACRCRWSATICACCKGRGRASLLKAASMAAFGLWVAATTIQHAVAGTVPAAPVMGVVGALAFATNLGVAALLYRWREGDSNMRSVWICTRNDAIGNLAVLAAAAGVLGSGTGWPDYLVAAVMSGLALVGAFQVARQAMAELADTAKLSSRA